MYVFYLNITRLLARLQDIRLISNVGKVVLIKSQYNRLDGSTEEEQDSFRKRDGIINTIVMD